MLDNKAEPNKIDELFNYIEEIRIGYRDFGMNIFDVILGEVIHGG
jgi:hypothetical protein